jgi:hypothetical protein
MFSLSPSTTLLREPDRRDFKSGQVMCEPFKSAPFTPKQVQSAIKDLSLYALLLSGKARGREAEIAKRTSS